MDLLALVQSTGIPTELLVGGMLLTFAVLTAGASFIVQSRSKPEISDSSSKTSKTVVNDKEALHVGLHKTRTRFLNQLNALLRSGNGLDADTREELEALLITSDLGLQTTQSLLDAVEKNLSKEELKNPRLIKERLKTQMLELIRTTPAPWPEATPTVVMVVGVNGAGKTTTIGKLAARYAQRGKKVLLAAGDTFRAAAVEQLEIWGERAHVDVMKGDEGSDPASVIFSAVEKAKNERYDLLLCDTAGRLQNKVNLMNELSKVHRVIGKAMPSAPHEVLLVLDATTGQNAVSQAQKFSEAVPVQSLALTKLDGSAKGGIILAISDQLDLPVRLVGLGEGIDDLRDFDPHNFVHSLFEDSRQGIDGNASQT